MRRYLFLLLFPFLVLAQGYNLPPIGGLVGNIFNFGQSNKSDQSPINPNRPLSQPKEVVSVVCIINPREEKKCHAVLKEMRQAFPELVIKEEIYKYPNLPKEPLVIDGKPHRMGIDSKYNFYFILPGGQGGKAFTFADWEQDKKERKIGGGFESVPVTDKVVLSRLLKKIAAAMTQEKKQGRPPLLAVDSSNRPVVGEPNRDPLAIEGVVHKLLLVGAVGNELMLVIESGGGTRPADVGTKRPPPPGGGVVPPPSSGDLPGAGQGGRRSSFSHNLQGSITLSIGFTVYSWGSAVVAIEADNAKKPSDFTLAFDFNGNKDAKDDGFAIRFKDTNKDGVPEVAYLLKNKEGVWENVGYDKFVEEAIRRGYLKPSMKPPKK